METNLKIDQIRFPDYFSFELNVWVAQLEMTDDEKKKFFWYKTTDGYLRKIDYREAWKMSFEKATKKDVMLTLKLPNFSYEVFEEITGITKEILDKKLQ